MATGPVAKMHADTDDETRAVRAAILRRLIAEERVEIAVQMSVDVRAIALAGIAERHPNASARERELELSGSCKATR